MTKPRFAVRVQNFIPQAGRVRKPRPDIEVYSETARKAEALGYDGITMYDHLYKSQTHVNLARRVMGPGYTIVPDTMPELWTTLTHMASITKKVRVVANVVSINFRAPSIVAAAASTLDNISNGRLEVGLGTGGDKEETRAYGLSIPRDPASRAQKLEEFIQVLKLMWTDEAPSYAGRYFKIRKAYAPLKPIQKPHPPINIGASNKHLLRVAAKQANIVTPALFCGGEKAFQRMKQIFATLELVCREVRRSSDEIRKAVIFRAMLGESKRELEDKFKMCLPPDITREEYESMVYCCTPKVCVEKIQDYLDEEVSYFLLDFMDLPSMDSLQLFATDVVKAV